MQIRALGQRVVAVTGRCSCCARTEKTEERRQRREVWRAAGLIGCQSRLLVEAWSAEVRSTSMAMKDSNNGMVKSTRCRSQMRSGPVYSRSGPWEDWKRTGVEDQRRLEGGYLSSSWMQPGGSSSTRQSNFNFAGSRSKQNVDDQSDGDAVGIRRIAIDDSLLMGEAVRYVCM